MPKYENSVIYKIKHNEDYDDNDIYVGSTSNFKNRKNRHKFSCINETNKGYNMPVYKYIRDNGNWNNFVMIPIEQYSCNNKDELKIRERYHIDILRPTLNKNIPSRTKKEYYEDNKEYLNEQRKKWREANKEQIAEKQKNYREANKDKIAKIQKNYCKNNKEQIAEKKKEYNEANKEQIAENKKKWGEANKEQIAEKRKEKAICDHCGCEIIKFGLKRHQQSKKCINYVKT